MKMRFSAIFANLILFCGCQNLLQTDSTPRSGIAGDTSLPTDSYTSGLGVKSGDELRSTFYSLTGIDPAIDGNNTSINTYYNDNAPNMPPTREIGSITPSKLLAISHFAGHFCDRLIGRSANRAPFFAGTPLASIFNSNALAANALDSADARLLTIRHYLSRFFRTEDPAGSYWQQSEAILVSLGTAVHSEVSTSTTRSAVIAKALCAAVLSSAPVTMY